MGFRMVGVYIRDAFAKLLMPLPARAEPVCSALGHSTGAIRMRHSSTVRCLLEWYRPHFTFDINQLIFRSLFGVFLANVDKQQDNNHNEKQQNNSKRTTQRDSRVESRSDRYCI
ncbi:hypothetical protein AA957_21905 [Pseudomonas trivialis]|uniref:Uncharacterized protein n=1 Tax=Pseudomonas trivialis TaxID=200450 RepID=A0A0H5AVY6_9PSED|nr:hypothetical protein AA957_21905 [Pseudomonas trivialis]